MADEDIVKVVTINNGGTVEAQIEGFNIILGIYDRRGDPVSDTLLTSFEVDELIIKLQDAVARMRHVPNAKNKVRMKSAHKKNAKRKAKKNDAEDTIPDPSVQT